MAKERTIFIKCDDPKLEARAYIKFVHGIDQRTPAIRESPNHSYVIVDGDTVAAFVREKRIEKVN